MQTDEELATRIESLRADKVGFLVAHLIRTGRLSQLEDLQRYARENDCHPSDVVKALIEITMTEIIPFFKLDDPIQVRERLLRNFDEALLRTMILLLWRGDKI